MSKYVKKLGSDKSYKRPKITYTEKLTNDEIAEKLQGYEKVDDITEVPLNTHMRYFKKESDGTQSFKTGGFLLDKQNADKYVRLGNGKNSWSVQVKTATFFKKMSHKDEISAIHKQYQKKLDEKDQIITKLKKYIQIKLKDTDINKIVGNQQRLNTIPAHHKSLSNVAAPKNISSKKHSYSNRSVHTKKKSSSGSKTSKSDHKYRHSNKSLKSKPSSKTSRSTSRSKSRKN